MYKSMIKGKNLNQINKLENQNLITGDINNERY